MFSTIEFLLALLSFACEQNFEGVSEGVGQTNNTTTNIVILWKSVPQHMRNKNNSIINRKDWN